MQQVKDRGRVWNQPSHAADVHHGISYRGLILLGVGGIIGGGFFLGCGLPIRMAGPAVLLSFLIGGLITAQVLGAVASIAVNHPVKGSFAVYANTYLGRFIGFLQGWVYYLTGILTITSESVAMGIFVQIWLPWVPVSVAAGVFCAFIIVLNAFGLKNFARVESVMSVVKIAALLGFIVYIGILVVTRWTGGAAPSFFGSSTGGVQPGWLPNGFSGLMQAMLIVIFAYSGIGVFAAGAAEVRNPRFIDKAALWTVILLTAMYIGSIGLLLCVVPWNLVNTSSSPFVLALARSQFAWLSSVFNGVILVAAFSVMAGTLYSANQILFSLGQNGEAPGFVRKRTRGGMAIGAFLTTVAGIAVTLGISVLLPANLYNFLVSASSFFTFFNWFIILWTFLVWRHRTTDDEKFTSKLAIGQPVSTFITMGLLLVLAGVALLQRDQRLGFYASVAIMVLMSVLYFIFGRKERLRHVTRQLGGKN